MSTRSLLCVTFAITAVALGGCTADRKPAPATPTALVAFDSCGQLRADLRSAAAASVGPYGFPGSTLPEVVMAGGVRSAADAVAVAGAPPAYSGTNVYELGADEPDMVKTDGHRIVYVSRGVLHVVDAATRRPVGQLRIHLGAVLSGPFGFGGDNLLLDGARALVLVPGGFATPGVISSMPGQGRPGAPDAANPAPPTPAGPRLLLVDVSGPPKLISTYQGDGALVDARLTGNTARVVLRSSPRITFPDNPRATGESDRVAANRAVAAAAPLDAWLPSWSVTTGGTTERGTVGCERVSRPATYSGSSMFTILTFELGAGSLGSGDPLSIVADGGTVYGTGTNLYVANDRRWQLGIWGVRVQPQDQRTEIYRFDTPAGRPPTFTGSGSVPGWLVNQYALSEWDGHLRVATTDDRAGSSAVRVLRVDGKRLTQVGEVDGLGKGERIYSVRFIGPRGYVVTFRQTDPLYSLDLADPRHPKITGTLKITGFSSHLQPAGDGRLIGVGQEADDQGRTQGTQVSLFDVSDPADPRRLAQYQVPGGYSEAQGDPHALLYWPATRLLVVPIMQGGGGSGALALRVTGDGLTPAGTVRDGDGGPVRRSLVVGDVLWTVSDDGLQASMLSTLDPLDWLPA